MNWIAKISLWLAVVGIAFLVIAVIGPKLLRKDMPRLRGVALIAAASGIGQWSIICLGLLPYLSGVGVSLSRRLRYFSAASDPAGAFIGMAVHIGLGLLLIGVGLFFGLRLVRDGPLDSLTRHSR